MSYTSLEKLKGTRPRFLRETAPAIPYQNLSLCCSVEGTGKSTFICGLMVDLLQNELHRSTKTIHLCTAEDDLQATTIPRLVAAGAKEKDLARIVVKDGRLWSFPSDLDEFSEFITTNDVALTVLDPIDHIIDGISSTAKGKYSLDRLDHLVKVNNCAILLVGHVNKGNHKNIRAALGGARRLLALSRSTWVWGEEPLGGELRGGAPGQELEYKGDLLGPMNPCSVLACVKNSLGAKWAPVLYENCPVPNPVDARHNVIVHRKVELADGAVLHYEPLSIVNGQVKTIQSKDAPQGSKRDQAKGLILKFLYHADADRGMSAAELAEAVQMGGISQETFERARKELAKDGAIECFQEKGIDGKTIQWRWRLPKLEVPDIPESG